MSVSSEQLSLSGKLSTPIQTLESGDSKAACRFFHLSVSDTVELVARGRSFGKLERNGWCEVDLLHKSEAGRDEEVGLNESKLIVA
eukprot:6483185-Amphidinium_carterae.1